MLAAFLVPNCVLSCQSAELWVQAESLGQSELERLRAQPYPPTAPSPRSETVGGHAYRARRSAQTLAPPDGRPAGRKVSREEKSPARGPESLARAGKIRAKKNRPHAGREKVSRGTR